MPGVKNADIFEGVDRGAKCFCSSIDSAVPDSLEVGSTEEMARLAVPGEWDGIIFYGESEGENFIAFTTGRNVSRKWTVVKRISTRPSMLDRAVKRWASIQIKRVGPWFCAFYAAKRGSDRFSFLKTHEGTALWSEYGSMQTSISFWRLNMTLYRPIGSALPKDKPPRWMLP